MKKTAVEWLEERYNDSLFEDNFICKDEFAQAKEMEKQQIIDAYWDGGQDIPFTKETCEQYYNQNFDDVV